MSYIITLSRLMKVMTECALGCVFKFYLLNLGCLVKETLRGCKEKLIAQTYSQKTELQSTLPWYPALMWWFGWQDLTSLVIFVSELHFVAETDTHASRCQNSTTTHFQSQMQITKWNSTEKTAPFLPTKGTSSVVTNECSHGWYKLS